MKRLKKITGFLLVVMLMFIMSLSVFAKEKSISSIDIDVELQDDGSAVITEIWSVQGISGGTEYFLAFPETEGMKVGSIFSVTDETGKEYELVDAWNTKASLEEKAYKCGILSTKDGVELCWGMGSYGDHTYTIRYTINNLVRAYEDYDGFSHQFVSSNMSSRPEFVSVYIWKADTNLEDEGAQIWAYDYTGVIEFTPVGGITGYTEKKLSSNDSVKITCRFEKGTFSPAITLSKTFEDEEAKKEPTPPIIILAAVAGVLAAIILLILIITFFNRRMKLADGTTVQRPTHKKSEPNWSIPFKGNIPATYSAMKIVYGMTTVTNAIGAYLLKWEQDSYISMEEVSNKKGKKKESAIIFLANDTSLSDCEKSLYKMLRKIAGDDGVLSQTKLEKWSQKNYNKFTEWEKKLDKEGRHNLKEYHMIEPNPKGKLKFNQSGYEAADRMMGFWRYLKEYSQRRTDDGNEGELWGEYLIYATLFGINDHVAKRLQAADPDYFTTYYCIGHMNTYSIMNIIHMTNSMTTTVAQVSTGDGGAAGVSGGGFSGTSGGGSR